MNDIISCLRDTVPWCQGGLACSPTQTIHSAPGGLCSCQRHHLCHSLGQCREGVSSLRTVQNVRVVSLVKHLMREEMEILQLLECCGLGGFSPCDAVISLPLLPSLRGRGTWTYRASGPQPSGVSGRILSSKI